MEVKVETIVPPPPPVEKIVHLKLTHDEARILSSITFGGSDVLNKRGYTGLNKAVTADEMKAFADDLRVALSRHGIHDTSVGPDVEYP